MLVLTRFRLADPPEDVARRLQETLEVLAEQRGFVSGHVGRNVDEPDLWVLQTQWEGPGAYRRALSAYDVKLRAWAILGGAIDEAGAYEVVTEGAELNRAEPRETP